MFQNSNEASLSSVYLSIPYVNLIISIHNFFFSVSMFAVYLCLSHVNTSTLESYTQITPTFHVLIIIVFYPAHLSLHDQRFIFRYSKPANPFKFYHVHRTSMLLPIIMKICPNQCISAS
jgi:hypothetical protein